MARYGVYLLLGWLIIGGMPLLAQDSIAPPAENFECLTTEDAFVRHIEQGAFQRGRRNYAQAYHEYNCAINLDPFSVLGYRGRGVSQLEQGSYQGALADFAIALDITPDDPYLYNSIGWIHYRMGDAQTALIYLNHAVVLDPNYAIAFNNRGLVERSIGEIEAALQNFQIAIDLGYPDRPYVPYVNMGDTYAEEAGDLHTAASWYELAAYTTPGQGFIHEKLGDVYVELGLWRKAAQHYEQFIYLEQLDRPEILRQVRLINIREFFLQYTPTLLIIGIIAYLVFASVYQRWRQRVMPPASNP